MSFFWHRVPATQKTYLILVKKKKKKEAVITAMLTKCSLLYKNCIFLSEIRKWLRTSHLGVTFPSPNYVKIKMNIGYGYTGFLTFIFSELASLLRNCSVPQRQVINAF